MIPERLPGTTRLVLVRHGATEDSSKGVCYGSLDVELSPLGRAQAARLALPLGREGLAAVYSSPRARAVQTARALGPLAEIRDALREIDFGAFEGRSYDEIAERHPLEYAEWMERPTQVRFPGGESYRDLRERATAEVAELRRRHAGRAFCVITHGGVCRALIADALAMPDDAIFRLAQDYGAISVIDWFGDGTPLVRLVNAIAI